MKLITTFSLLLLCGICAFGADQKKPGGPPGNGGPSGAPGSGGPSEGGRPDINSEEAFNRFDINRDGVVIKVEFLASPMAQSHPDSAEKFFSTKDKNHDQIISKAEWTTAKIERPPGGKGPGSGGPNGKMPKKP